MNQIQTDVSDQALVIAIRANLCDFFHELEKKSAGRKIENEKFSRWQTPIAHPWFNGVMSSQPPVETDSAFLEDCILYFHQQNVSVFTWWTEPDLNCSAWEPFLSRQGFGFSNDTPGMAVDLQGVNEPAQTADWLEVRKVTDEESLQTWAHIFTIGYGLPPAWASSVYEIWAKLGLDFPTFNYLGYWNGKPVATSSLYFGAGVAGIYSVSTLPEARGQGIGAAMTLYPLQKAREMGYRIGVLQSSEMGYSVYKKLGFRHLCQIEYFCRKL